MILRRITDAFRKQDWFTVAVETLIVVFGVFIGLQVNNWNEEQDDKRRGNAYVDRLAVDVRTDIKDRGNLLSYYEAVNDSAERTVVLLAGPSPDPQELIINAYRATEYANHQPTRSTWDEIVSSGDIGLLPPAFVEDGLTEYFKDNTAYQAQLNILSSSYRKRVRRAIPHKIQLAIREGCGDMRDEIGNVTGFRAECSLNISDAELTKAAEALLNDPEVLPDLWLHFSYISSARGDLRGTMYALENALSALEGGPPNKKQAPAP